MGLQWSTWMPLMAAHPLALAQLPSDPGFYRIRRVSDREHLQWIGWAGRGVRESVERLSRQVHLPIPPYDDPSGPALELWNLRRVPGMSFQVSGTAARRDLAWGVEGLDELRAAYRRESSSKS